MGLNIETLQAIAQFVSSVGFPIVVALLVIFRLDRSVLALTDAITELRLAVKGGRRLRDKKGRR